MLEVADVVAGNRQADVLGLARTHRSPGQPGTKPQPIAAVDVSFLRLPFRFLEVKPTGDRFRFEGLPVGQVFLAGLAPPAPFGRRCIFDAGDDEAER
ncbi:MAG TPA: hypothetical protein VJ526_08800, partial [Beijerinckiaceae bacterium]|nr:hypothetical protein [Beijerinckiaceae bacterium]